MRNVKVYKVNEDFEIQCIIVSNEYTGTKWFQVDAVCIAVEWEEVVESSGKIENSDEANKVFKQYVSKYGNMHLPKIY